MTAQEEREWVAMLGRTKEDQIKVIRDLMRHASEDKMSMEDRIVCRRQLMRLNDELKRGY